MASEPGEKEDRECFEALYEQLESVVSKLEEGAFSLEESVNLYEKGMMLARRCREILGEAELRISQLQEALPDQVDADPRTGEGLASAPSEDKFPSQ